jgi:hypothetical protein
MLRHETASASRVGGSGGHRGRVERRACSCPQHEAATIPTSESRTWAAGVGHTQQHEPLECNIRASTKAGVSRGLLLAEAGLGAVLVAKALGNGTQAQRDAEA